jgi:hypothetical protein
MNVYLLVFLWVMVIPLAEGVLFALWLREVHARHPLPLGGVIATGRATPSANVSLPAAEPVDTENAPEATESPVPPEPAAEEPRETTPPEASPKEPSEVSVFDGTEKIPQNMPVNEILEKMTTASPQEIPNDFEHRIESSARSEDELHSGIQHTIMDDMDENDLAALAGALPRDNIDFKKELETDSDNVEEISSTAKEVLGEDFDLDALETQATEFATALAEKKESTEIPLDVQENETGTIQVSSPFATNVSPQLAEFIIPQTIFSTFSDDWIQEAGDAAETIAGDPENFCFTEESRPMFIRKKKSS